MLLLLSIQTAFETIFTRTLMCPLGSENVLQEKRIKALEKKLNRRLISVTDFLKQGGHLTPSFQHQNSVNPDMNSDTSDVSDVNSDTNSVTSVVDFGAGQSNSLPDVSNYDFSRRDSVYGNFSHINNSASSDVNSDTSDANFDVSDVNSDTYPETSLVNFGARQSHSLSDATNSDSSRRNRDYGNSSYVNNYIDNFIDNLVEEQNPSQINLLTDSFQVNNSDSSLNDSFMETSTLPATTQSISPVMANFTPRPFPEYFNLLTKKEKRKYIRNSKNKHRMFVKRRRTDISHSVAHQDEIQIIEVVQNQSASIYVTQNDVSEPPVAVPSPRNLVLEDDEIIPNVSEPSVAVPPPIHVVLEDYNEIIPNEVSEPSVAAPSPIPVLDEDMEIITVDDSQPVIPLRRFLSYHTRPLDDACKVCLLKYREEDILLQLRCHHHAHKWCMEEWLKTKSICPYCRQDC